VSYGKSLLWLFACWALAPLLVWFAVFWRNANLAGGVAGGRGCGLVVFVWFIYDLPRYIAELASRSLSHSAGVSRFVACWFLVVLLCLVWFLFAFSLLHWDCDGSLDYVLVHASSSFEAFINSLRQCIN
jgi:Na+(H+)/acetate symporter ActP